MVYLFIMCFIFYLVLVMLFWSLLAVGSKSFKRYAERVKIEENGFSAAGGRTAAVLDGEVEGKEEKWGPVPRMA